ncbi:hypothetical protein BFW38_04475 [Terasakiispira papahanaumokuakeensis]|uniref:Serine aminopeptidase S33 domain-containing protein n=1 Tax=Terasakiispira papahanaumokuakeensis TaxID=197479 RepID=A0A1E2V7E1_9GAMM|nr:alpha/beta hydrolase [Terasakiispira papahanaumokuakeensis]ODC02919.1 hypothetical protein BFW38_04475 [Terasakiispira papahanaumokuakeensis]
MSKKSVFRLWLVVVVVLVSFVVIRFLEFDLSGTGTHKYLSFTHKGDELKGTLILPSNKPSPPFVLLVHGDGPQDRWSNEGYTPLVNFLVSQGIAVFSWDKPGIGQSTGNWLSQTMADRAEEAALAMQRLRQLPELKKSRGGYLGFSQAGWVVPEASQRAKTDFVVLIGAAINWKAQGLYYMKARLEHEGLAAADIATAIQQESEAFDAQYTQAATMQPCSSQCTRQDFERLNARSDAKQSITSMQSPVLLLMGGNDRNVDPDTTVSVWRQLLPQRVPRCIKKVPEATHGLLRSALFDYQLPSQWPLWKEGLFVFLGPYAYSPEALNTIAMWIKQRQCSGLAD